MQSRLPVWVVALPFLAAIKLLVDTRRRELIIEVGLASREAIYQPWYADHATLTRVHLVCGALLTIFGFVQFVTRLRTRYPAVHRWNGRFVVAAGGVAAVTGIWMNAVFPVGGLLKHVGGYFFGIAVIVGVALGIRAIRRGDVSAHRTWMSRAFAIAIAAGIQRWLMSLWGNLFGEVTELVTGVCLWLGAAIALSLAEFWRRRVPLDE